MKSFLHKQEHLKRNNVKCIIQEEVKKYIEESPDRAYLPIGEHHTLSPLLKTNQQQGTKKKPLNLNTKINKN
jgi:hypothetical protein